MRKRLALFFLCAFFCSLAVSGESRPRFLTGDSAAIPVWLVSGPLAEALPETDLIPREGDPVGGSAWVYLHSGGKPVELNSLLPGRTSYFYAYAEIDVAQVCEPVFHFTTFSPAALWVDGKIAARSRASTYQNVWETAAKAEIAPGTHRLLLKLEAKEKIAYFGIAAVASQIDGKMQPFHAARFAVTLQDFTPARRAEAIGNSLSFLSEPRFIDGEERLRFYLRFLAGMPELQTPLCLKISSPQAEWLNATGKPESFAEAVSSHLLVSVKPQVSAWGKATVAGELLAGADVLATLSVDVFCESGLKDSVARLRASLPEDTSAETALARLSLEQIDLLTASRVNRTFKYGEKSASLVERAELALAAAREKRDPLAGARGIQEAAYICDADNSVQPYRYYVPLKPQTEKLPLVVFFHGYVPSYNKLDWMKIEPELAAAMEATGCALLLPFGRSNTDFLSIGEVDVLRALEEMKKRYPIDETRIYLAGYSMGGSGVWTMLSHYPGVFAAAQVWSGRTDYFFWHAETYERNLASRETIPPWKRTLLESDNPYDLAATLTDVPVRAAHPKDDSLVKYGHSSRIFEKLKPPLGQMEFLTPPEGFGHWYFSEEMNKAATYRWLLQHKRNSPQTVEHITYTPKYGKKYWLSIDEIEQWGKPARIRARIDADNKRVVVELCENVRAFSLNFIQARGVESVSFSAGGDRFEIKAMPRAGIAGEFFTCRLRGEKKDLSKTATLCGPVKEAFNSPFLLVVGDGEKNEANAAQFVKDWQTFARGTPRLKKHGEVIPADSEKYNLVLFGDPEENSCLRKIADRLPVKFLPDGYGVGDREERGENLGLCAIYPNPENQARYVVLLDGLYYGQSLSFNHKWDLTPDYIIFSEATDPYDGTNTARLAGFFNSDWRFDPNLSHRPQAEPLPERETP
jgi:predicted esterase